MGLLLFFKVPLQSLQIFGDLSEDVGKIKGYSYLDFLI